MFEWKNEDADLFWPTNKRKEGLTALEASDMVKGLVMKFQNKLPQEWVKTEPWLNSMVVSQLVRENTRQSFIKQAEKGKLKDMDSIIAFCYDF